MSDFVLPIELEFQKAADGGRTIPLSNFSSYNFDQSLLTPASAFRFTAPGPDKNTRTAIRSGDTVTLWGVAPSGVREKLGTGFIDETDTHVTPKSVDYVLTGRDTLGQLVDNAAVDASNAIVNTTQLSLPNIAKLLIRGTRVPQEFITSQVPNGTLLFQTNPGETKITSLQRYLDLMNCLVWAAPNGQMIIGKPDFTQPKSGTLILSSSSPSANNVIEGRCRRNLNQSIRQIVTQLQTLDQVSASSYTKLNNDPDMKRVAKGLVGKSIYRRFSYGAGEDSVNQVTAVGSQSGNPNKMGDEYSLREIAKENTKVIDVEMVVEGHFNTAGAAFKVNQVYNVQIEDDDLNEDMLLYAVSYELTIEHGLISRLRFCRLGSIVASADAIRRNE